MRAFPIISLLEPLPSSPVFFFNAAASASASAIIISFNNPNNKRPQILAAPKRSISLTKFIRSSTSNVDLGGDDSDVDDYSSSLDEEEEAKSELERGDGEYFEIEKLGKNTRRIRSRIIIDAPFHTLWNILTDYERLADFIPGLAVSQLLHKTDNYARLFQVITLDLTITFFCRPCFLFIFI
jgi:hypothetical protein